MRRTNVRYAVLVLGPWTARVTSEAKRCTGCGELKPLVDFKRLAKAQDGREPMCRECHKAYHHENRARHMEQIARRKQALVERNQALVVEHLIRHPCADCGETDVVVLEFDHVRGKKLANVSAMVRDAETWRLEEEMEKCEVVCANCHRRRTAHRLGWCRAGVVGRLGLEPRTTTD
jgi:hypothetical protein